MVSSLSSVRFIDPNWTLNISVAVTSMLINTSGLHDSSDGSSTHRWCDWNISKWDDFSMIFEYIEINYFVIKGTVTTVVVNCYWLSWGNLRFFGYSIVIYSDRGHCLEQFKKNCLYRENWAAGIWMYVCTINFWAVAKTEVSDISGQTCVY